MLTLGVDTYATLDFANSFIPDFIRDSEWAALTDPEKESLLKLGTLALDLKFGSSLLGVKTSSTQNLLFPRARLKDYDGNILDYTKIPDNVMKATCYLASASRTDDLLSSYSDGNVRSKSVTVGPISISKEYSSGARSGEVHFPAVNALMSMFIEGSANVRVVRG